MPERKPLRVGQFSAFYGDRDDGIRQLVESDVHFLVGDYLAELTMLVLRKNQLRGRPGYATTFLRQVKNELSSIAEKGIKVVTNAGGLDPAQCADDLREILLEQGLDLTVATVTGDNLLEDLPELQAGGEKFENLDTGEELEVGRQEILTANAYLGAWPIVEALNQGADIVICSRVTDASVVMGPAMWHFGWKHDDWDQLAGALVAGHVIECGAQATGGQFSLFDAYDDLGLPGMPIATVESDGSCVISKAAGSGGIVSTDTVTAQLLYEIGSPLYENPDVLADFTTVRIEQVAHDQVRISGTQGSAPSDRLKVSLSHTGGYRNRAVVGLTGGRVQAKVDWLKREVEKLVGPPASFDGFTWNLVGPAKTQDGFYDEMTAFVVISAKDKDQKKVSRNRFSAPITQIAVSNIPGYYLLTPPAAEQMYGVYWPTTVAKSHVHVSVRVGDDEPQPVSWTAPTRTAVPVLSDKPHDEAVVDNEDDLVQVPLHDIIGTRSGDKGGLANVGVWERYPGIFAWMRRTLTADEFVRLVPEAAGLEVSRFELPNLGALNFVVKGYLDEGVASCLRIDAQAKGLGEYLGSKTVSIPRSLLDPAARTADLVSVGGTR